MYKVVYYRGNSKIPGKENWEKFQMKSFEEEKVNIFLRREKLFDKNYFQSFVAAIDVIKDDDVIAYGRLSYSGPSDNHRSCIWEGKDLRGKTFSFIKEGTDMLNLYTPFLIGENLS